MLRSLYHSPALRAAGAFGVGGAAFSIGNLILARILPSYEYGLISLVIGVVSVAGPTAPLGTDYVLARRGLMLDAALRRRVLITSTLIGLATVVIAELLYDLRISLLSVILVTTVAMGVSQAVAAHYQSQRQFGSSVPFMQSSNWALCLIAVITWMSGAVTAATPAALVAIFALITAAIGWAMVAKRTAGVEARPALAGIWGEAVPLMAINVAGTMLLQVERLIIPVTIGIGNLALYGVAAALVGSPFRMLQMAVTFTVIPRLRDTHAIPERRRLLWHEFLLFTVVMGPSSVAIWLLAPRIAHWFLSGRYDLDGALIIAMIISGLLKVLSAFGTAVVSALASEKGLRLLSSASWGCLALAIALAFALRQWGITGIIYATAAGWLARTGVAFWISVPHLSSTAHHAPAREST
jgi:O-antigen/teichoic acid export membrane protein